MNCPSNNLKTVAAHYTAKITALYPEEEARNIVWMLLEHFFGMNRLTSAVNPDLRLSESELLIFHNACKKILQHIPVQYVIGKTKFCGLSFEVNESTLIPRPETEQLVHNILNDEKLRFSSLRILDIGTGSGCIAVALKKHRPDCELFACDISREALQMAQKNAEKHDAPVHFFCCDVLSANVLSSIPKVEIIVSNPPYVCLSEKAAMRSNVLLHEPATALFVSDEDPLLFYKAIANIAANRLNAGGKIFFEINEKFGNAVADILRTHGFTDITVENDFRGKERFAWGGV
ncbi:MAG: peptide chain release factor N(5)-glutamine methyltransferase [Bacteroidales bacterium]|nr:peptide chain release factor N(5)-glutamine methyltransferase [Bacteroidales bacterium]